MCVKQYVMVYDIGTLKRTAGALVRCMWRHWKYNRHLYPITK